MSGVIVREDFSDGIYKFHNGGRELSDEDIQDIAQLIEWDFQGQPWDYYADGDDINAIYVIIGE